MQFFRFYIQTATFTAVFLTLACASLQADVRLPHIFGDHMVLQQQKPIAVWGWADPGEEVTVQFGEDKQSTAANDKGEWSVALPSHKADRNPSTFTVIGKNTIVFDDVVVGEVWIGSGQSNMEMGMSLLNNANEEIAKADFPLIRLFIVPRTFNTLPQKDVDAQWRLCSPKNIVEMQGWGGFSAVEYFFGRELFRVLDVPVGLIEAAHGGTPIEAWTAPEGFAASSQLDAISKMVQLKDPRTDVHQKQLANFVSNMEEWCKQAALSVRDKTVSPRPPEFPCELDVVKSPVEPTALYNAMIRPIEPLSIRGIIWYQGENNHCDGKIYAEKMRVLIESWRKLFKQSDLAFYYTLIAPFNYGSENPFVVPEFWEAQAAALSIPNTGMVVTSDIGDINDVHPKNKQEVGRRLALLALAKSYGKDLVYLGPTFKSIATEDNKLRITFENAEDGLISKDGKPLRWFEIIDKQKGDFRPASAEIDGDSVVLTADGVANPVAVRFGWSKVAEPNLANKAGLPAMPFRAGHVSSLDNFPILGSEVEGYQLVYDLDLSKLGNTIAYDVDNSEQVKKPFSRIAYFLELTDSDERSSYIFVSMDAFTDDVRKIGVPVFASHATFQTKVKNMNVRSNVPGIISGTGLSGGNIEFWPNNYAPSNALRIPEASDLVFDFGDQYSDPADGYGCMQVHNLETRQTLFAINNLKGGNAADIGIGNAPARYNHPDWTFAKNAGDYRSKRLRIFIH